MDSSNSDQTRHQASEPLGASQAYGSGMPTPIQQSPNSDPDPWNLKRFYNMDGPWVPKNIIVTDASNQSFAQVASNLPYVHTGSSFQQYRTKPALSECDTANDDSGYGSTRPPYSTTENTSVYEDDSSPDAYNAAQLLNGCHLEIGSVSDAPTTNWPQTRAPSSISGHSGKFWCPNCNQWLKTRSELNKHNLRHNKPFRCDVPACTRKDGFGTKNDLDRHKKSVHSDRSVAGTLYICRLDQCGSQNKPKLWPRADNFRSHLRRIHHKNYSADDNLEEYIYRDAQLLPGDTHPALGSMSRSQPTLGKDLEGVGGNALLYAGFHKSANASFSQSLLGGQTMATDHTIILDDEFPLLQDSTSPLDEKDTPVLATQDSDDMLMQSDILKGTGQGSMEINRSFSEDMISLHDTFYQDASQSDLVEEADISLGQGGTTGLLEDVSESLDHGSEENSSFEASFTQGRDSEPTKEISEQPDVKIARSELERTSAEVKIPSSIEVSALFKNKNENEILDALKSVPKDLLKMALGGADAMKLSIPSQDSAGQRNLHKCPECSKSFNRPCELKKHLKRHEKPYGCTFENCTKSFGSKNDWKRHESSQHWQLEIWKCEEPKSHHKEPCGKICPRRESFRNHLQKEHTLTDQKQVDERMDRCRIGRHCDPRFWCGFCRTVIEINSEGVNAWTKRCDHIDNHFSGREGFAKKSISQWKYLGSEDDKGDKSHFDLSTQAVAKQSSSSPESLAKVKVPISVKRKTGSDCDAPLPKKQKQNDIAAAHDMWTCCTCGELDMVIKVSAACHSCQHQNCKDCNKTRVLHRDEYKVTDD